MLDAFIMARNPEADSSLPYLMHLPFEGHVAESARDVAAFEPSVLVAEISGNLRALPTAIFRIALVLARNLAARRSTIS